MSEMFWRVRNVLAYCRDENSVPFADGVFVSWVSARSRIAPHYLGESERTHVLSGRDEQRVPSESELCQQ